MCLCVCVCYVSPGCDGLNKKKRAVAVKKPWALPRVRCVWTGEGSDREGVVTEDVPLRARVGCLVMEKGVVGVSGAERETDCRYGGGGGKAAKR